MFKAGIRPEQFFLSVDVAPLCLRQESPPVREDFLIEYFSDTVFPRIRKMGYQAYEHKTGNTSTIAISQAPMSSTIW